MPHQSRDAIRYFGLELTWLPEKGTVPSHEHPLVNPLAVCLGISLEPNPALYILHAARENSFDPHLNQVIFKLSVGATYNVPNIATTTPIKGGVGLGICVHSGHKSSGSSNYSQEFSQCSCGQQTESGPSNGSNTYNNGYQSQSTVRKDGKTMENLVFHVPMSSLSPQAHEVLLTLLANGELVMENALAPISPPNSPLDGSILSNSNYTAPDTTPITIAPHDVIRDLATLTLTTYSLTEGAYTPSPILHLRVPHPVRGIAKRCGACRSWEGMKRKSVIGKGECGYYYRRWRQCKCGQEWYCRERCRRRIFSLLENGEMKHDPTCEEWRLWREGQAILLRITAPSEETSVNLYEQDACLEDDHEDSRSVLDDHRDLEELYEGDSCYFHHEQEDARNALDAFIQEMELSQHHPLNNYLSSTTTTTLSPEIMTADLSLINKENENPLTSPTSPIPAPSRVVSKVDPTARPDSGTLPPDHDYTSLYNSSTISLQETSTISQQQNPNMIITHPEKLDPTEAERRFRASYERVAHEIGSGFSLMPLPQASLTPDVVDAVIEMANISPTRQPAHTLSSRPSVWRLRHRGEEVLVEGRTIKRVETGDTVSQGSEMAVSLSEQESKETEIKRKKEKKAVANVVTAFKDMMHLSHGRK